MDKYVIPSIMFGFAVIMVATIYGGMQNEHRRIECKQHMATTTQRSAEEIVRLCR